MLTASLPLYPNLVITRPNLSPPSLLPPQLFVSHSPHLPSFLDPPTLVSRRLSLCSASSLLAASLSFSLFSLHYYYCLLLLAVSRFTCTVAPRFCVPVPCICAKKKKKEGAEPLKRSLSVPFYPKRTPSSRITRVSLANSIPSPTPTRTHPLPSRSFSALRTVLYTENHLKYPFFSQHFGRKGKKEGSFSFSSILLQHTGKGLNLTLPPPTIGARSFALH